MLFGMRVPQIRRRARDATRALALAWEAAPGSTLAWGVLLVVQGLLPAASVVALRTVVNRLVEAAAAGHAAVVVVPALALAGIMAAGHIADVLARYIRIAQTELVADHVRAVVHRKAGEVDYAFFETPGYFDDLYRVLHESGNRPLALLESLGTVARDGLTVLALAAVLVPYGAWLPLVLFVGAVPAFLVLLRYNRRSHAWWASRTEEHRRADYFDDLLTHALAAAEVRLFDLGSRFRAAHGAIRRRLRGERISMERSQAIARLGAAMLALAALGGAMAWMVWRVVAGVSRLGDLALFYQALVRGQAALAGMLDSAGQVHEHGLYLRHLFHFLDQQPAVVAPEKPAPAPQWVRSAIRLQDVSFRYPGSEEQVLDRLTLEIPAGRIVAVVGENGAGKSTLVKLLARLYDPAEGSICIDSTDLRQLDPADLRRRIAAVCQFPVNYHATPAEVIALGAHGEPDARRVQLAAAAAGAHERVLALPAGYATQLGKEFADGHELSGGEWQRLALARAFYRDAAILLLDEPTSMMDAWAEETWIEELRRHAEGRTTVLVTHRFSLARAADWIVVMHCGQIVEAGTHADLVQLGGRYHDAWSRAAPAIEAGLIPSAALASYDAWGSA
jgi:ATP-binding cassette subfamily B protein